MNGPVALAMLFGRTWNSAPVGVCFTTAPTSLPAEFLLQVRHFGVVGHDCTVFNSCKDEREVHWRIVVYSHSTSVHTDHQHSQPDDFYASAQSVLAWKRTLRMIPIPLLVVDWTLRLWWVDGLVCRRRFTYLQVTAVEQQVGFVGIRVAPCEERLVLSNCVTASDVTFFLKVAKSAPFVLRIFCMIHGRL